MFQRLSKNNEELKTNGHKRSKEKSPCSAGVIKNPEVGTSRRRTAEHERIHMPNVSSERWKLGLSASCQQQTHFISIYVMII
jgi:hypothetical protein